VATSPSGSTLYKVYPAALACGGVELDQCLVWLRVVQLINKPHGDREQTSAHGYDALAICLHKSC
jgi:hypothetical protein